MNKLISTKQIKLISHGDDVRVDSRVLSQFILPGGNHKTSGRVNQDIVKTIKTYSNEFQELGKIRFETAFNPQGKPTEYALLNEPQTNFLFMCIRNINPIVLQVKKALAKRFDEMRRLLIQRSNAEWIAYRESGKIVTKRLNDLFTHALDEVGKSHDKHRYINLQQAIYEAALGKTCQQLREERDIKKHHTIRDYLDPKELERISLLQSMTELTLQQHEHVTDSMVIAAVANSGHMLITAINCPLIATQHKGAA